jgi:hypothetical protein
MSKRTTTEAELREWLAQGKTHGEIAKSLGFHRSTVASACAVLGIESKVGRGAGKGRVSTEAYLADMRSGLTLTEIAKKHGKASAGVVYSLLRFHGLPTCARKLLLADAAKQQQAA